MGMEGYTYETLTGTIVYNSRAYAFTDKLNINGIEYIVYYICGTNIIYTVNYDDINKKWVISSNNINTVI